jgi:hypothetical protein
MTTTDRYTSIPQTVEAIQWDGSARCLSQLQEWAPERVGRHGEGLLLLAGKDGAQKWVPVPVGHWIVRQPGDLSDHWPVDPGYFAAKYKPAANDMTTTDRAETSCEYIVTADEGTSYCSLAEGTVLFEGTLAGLRWWTVEQFDNGTSRDRFERRVRVVAVDHQETTDG